LLESVVKRRCRLARVSFEDGWIEDGWIEDGWNEEKKEFCPRGGEA
jgi:hypothetical protein